MGFSQWTIRNRIGENLPRQIWGGKSKGNDLIYDRFYLIPAKIIRSVYIITQKTTKKALRNALNAHFILPTQPSVIPILFRHQHRIYHLYQPITLVYIGYCHR